MKLAFSHLNLKFNPFGELNPEQRKQLAVVDIEKIKNILNKPGVAIQFLADHGRGKTTHLLSLHELYPEAKYIKIFSGDKPDFEFHEIYFIDSIENISKKQRNFLYKNSSSIACTTHTDLSRELNRAGYEVVSKRVSLYDENILKKVFNDRIEYSRRGEGDIPVIDLRLINSLKQLYGDDIRSMEHHLYEKFQTLERIDNVKV